MTREHTTEIELPAPTEEVWRALTDASFVQSWYAPEVRIEPRVGGEYFVSWGGGMDAAGTIDIFEPERRLRVSADRSGVVIAIDYFLEAEGGKTRLRLVHSGFPTSAGWDAEYEGTKRGWPIMLRILRFGLAHHPGIPGSHRWLYLTAAIPPEEAWSKFAALFRSTGAEYANEPSEFCAAWAEPGPGLIYAAFTERKGGTGVSLHVVLYGEAAARIEDSAADWKLRLQTLYTQEAEKVAIFTF